MQPVADLRILDLAEVAVDVQEEIVERVVAGPVFDVQIVVQLRGLDQRPDLGPHRRQLRGVERGHGRVFVQQLLELGQIAVGVGAGHGRHEMVDDRGVRPALGLGALAGVVDDERVDQRQIAEHGIRRARRRQAQSLTGQPFQRAVLAQMHDGMGAELVRQPPVRGEVMVARCEGRVVVDGDRILAEAARRLDGEHDVAEAQARQHDL